MTELDGSLFTDSTTPNVHVAEASDFRESFPLGQNWPQEFRAKLDGFVRLFKFARLDKDDEGEVCGVYYNEVNGNKRVLIIND